MPPDTDIRSWFIELDFDRLPWSIFLVRSSILRAVRANAHLARGVIADLGCGEMPYREEFSNSKVDRYIGIDLEHSKYHNTVKPDYFWNGHDIPLENGSVDYLIATEFFEHYYDTVHILKEINRVLKPGGSLFFTVPNVWPIHEPPYDYHRFTPFTLQKAFDAAGFESVNINPLGGHDYHLAITISIWYENRLAGRSKRFLKPFVSNFIKYLIRRDRPSNEFKVNTMYSGLWGIACPKKLMDGV